MSTKKFRPRRKPTEEELRLLLHSPDAPCAPPDTYRNFVHYGHDEAALILSYIQVPTKPGLAMQPESAAQTKLARRPEEMMTLDFYCPQRLFLTDEGQLIHPLRGWNFPNVIESMKADLPTNPQDTKILFGAWQAERHEITPEHCELHGRFTIESPRTARHLLVFVRESAYTIERYENIELWMGREVCCRFRGDPCPRGFIALVLPIGFQVLEKERLITASKEFGRLAETYREDCTDQINWIKDGDFALRGDARRLAQLPTCAAPDSAESSKDEQLINRALEALSDSNLKEDENLRMLAQPLVAEAKEILTRRRRAVNCSPAQLLKLWEKDQLYLVMVTAGNTYSDPYEALVTAINDTELMETEHATRMKYRPLFEIYKPMVKELGGWLGTRGNRVELLLFRDMASSDDKPVRKTYFAFTARGLKRFLEKLKVELDAAEQAQADASSIAAELQHRRRTDDKQSESGCRAGEQGEDGCHVDG